MFALFVAACASNIPAPSVSDYVKTEGGGFMIERNEGVKYAMTYSLLLSASSSATFYKAVFESTIPNGELVSTEGNIEEGNSKLLVQSPVIPGVKNNQTYSVSLILFKGGEQLVAHKDKVKFSIPSSVLEQFGVKEY